jgi:hypothetical protein
VGLLLCATAPAGAAPRAPRAEHGEPRGVDGTPAAAAERDGGATLGTADSAGAQREERPISVALVLGYGFSLEEESDNPWGVGFGARGGYNLGAVFAGARFVFYAGDEPSNIWEIGLEGGYDLRAGFFTARPGVGLGLANVTLQRAAAMDSLTALYLAPGLTLLVDLASDVFLGAEGRVQWILSEPGREAVIALGSAGMRF